jgi:hypothetical protein
MKQQMKRSGTALVAVMAICAASIPTAVAQESSTSAHDPATDETMLDGLDPQAEVLVIDVGEEPGDQSALVVDVSGLSDPEQHEVASDLEIALDTDAAQIVPAGEAESQLALNTTVGAALREAGAPQGGGGVVTAMKTAAVSSIKCKADKDFVDSNNTLNIRNNCPDKKVNWAIKLSAGLRGIINSNVREDGARGWRNGVALGKNAQHLSVAKTYLFHGTFSISSVPASFRIDDQFDFTIRSGGKTLPANLYVCKTVNLTK